MDDTRENWMYEDTSHDERIGFRTVETAMGTLTVYTADEPGPKGHKAGTTIMVYHDPPVPPYDPAKDLDRDSFDEGVEDGKEEN